MMQWDIDTIAPARKNASAGINMMGARENLAISIGALVAALICFAVFYGFPELDMAIARAFANDDGRFYLSGDPYVAGIRKAFLYGVLVYYAVVIFCWIDAYQTQLPVLGQTWDKWAYQGFCAILGPIVVVNVVLKANWGRARPRELEEFGGSLEFTPFWDWTNQCVSNCSFTSGEVAGISMLFIALAFLLSRPVRYAVFLIGVLTAGLVSWMRIAMGGHFASDTVMSIILMTIVAAELYYAFYLTPGDWIGKMNKRQLVKLGRDKEPDFTSGA